jgi:hypothetical protein
MTVVTERRPGPGEEDYWADLAEPDSDSQWEWEQGKRRPVEIKIPLRGPAALLQTPVSPKLTVEEIRRTLDLAFERVGRSDDDRARWLLRFAATELPRISPGQRVDLEWEILAFTTPWDSRVLRVEVDSEGEIRVHLDSLHSWIRDGIHSLRGDLPPGADIEVDSRGDSSIVVAKLGDVEKVRQIAERRKLGILPSWQLNAHKSCRLTRVKDRVVADEWEQSHSMLGRFEAEACRVLSMEARRFRFCHNCGKPFIARKSQAYCSSTCSQTFRTRVYRAKDPDQARAKRREAYERSMHRKHGPNVRIRRRIAANNSKTDRTAEDSK